MRSIDVATLGAAELVDRFTDVKRQHDELMLVAHGGRFLSFLVAYYILNWCWVCFLIVVSELDTGVAQLEPVRPMRHGLSTQEGHQHRERLVHHLSLSTDVDPEHMGV